LKRVVFDTNTVASASFWQGTPMQCLRAWQAGRCEALVSPAILAEYAEVTDRLQARYPDRSPVRWGAALAASAELVFPNVRLRDITPDPDDEMFLECAVAGEAHFLVTGDKRHLQSLVQVREVRIVSPAAFLDILREEQ
jgi:putative PIN family toxin of toxin-antitoxin system